MNNEVIHNNAASNNNSGIVTKILLGGALVGAFGGWFYQANQVDKVRGELTSTQQKMEELHGKMDASVSMVKAEANESIAKVQTELEKTRKDAQSQVAVATRNQSRATQAAVASLSTKNAELAKQLDAYKTENAEKSTKVDETITGIKGDVTDVKTEVANTKGELEKAVAELKRVNGDMGVISDRIATNSTELQALRQLGERNYFEFTIYKGKGAQKVGDVQLALKKADMKRNRFTMDVTADEHKVEKKDKGVNEPVQFYTANARIPYEIVVNQVTKDRVSGYLAVPKVTVARK